MNFVFNLPLFLIVASLFSSVLTILLDDKGARMLSLFLSAGVTFFNFILFVYVYNTGSDVSYMMGHFPHPFGNELRISLLESFFVCVFSLVLFLTLWGGKQAIDEFDEKSDKRNIYYTMINLIQAAIIVLVYTSDLFTSYVFVEIMTLASTGILVARDNGRTTAAATRYMIFALVGSGLFLFGIVFLYNITGHLLMVNLKESVALLWSNGAYHLPLLASMCFISIGLAIKSGLFPFHFWMADTYGEAIPTSSGILSGIISKVYIFLLIKIIFNVFGVEVFYSSGLDKVLYVLGILGIVMGSVSAVRENNIYRMCAYSSAAQIGYIYLGIGLSPTVGVSAALFQMVAHAFTKPAIFLASYRLSSVSNNAKKFKNLEGAGKRDKFAAIIFTFEALSMVGIPLTMGFISKYLFATSAFGHVGFTMIITLFVLVVSTILNTLYFTRTIIRIFTMHDKEKKYRYKKAPLEYLVSATLFVFVNIYFGIFASDLIALINEGLIMF